MPKARDNYQVTATALPELITNLNFLFQRFADRMDKIEGIRGAPKMESDLSMTANQITDVGTGTEGDDAAIRDDLLGTGPTFAGLTVTGDACIEGKIEVKDSDGNIIHSME